jgi:MoCo/4Fe-4S cofactor protein with predicted Tat translocation signal
MSEMNQHEDHNHADHNHDAHETKTQIQTDDRYWQTIEQWQKDPEFQKALETEFMSSPIRDGADPEDGIARREFLKLMGASLALATAGCIRRPVEKIIPYNKQPEEVTFGVPNYYTSTFFDGSQAIGLLVKTREGRPIKLEGNPADPLSQGRLNARAQAHILSLYDPERLQGPKRNLLNKEKTNRDTINVSWDDADKAVTDQLKKGGVTVLTGNVNSPSMRALISDFTSAFKAKHITWEPMAYEEVREGQKACYGDDFVPLYQMEKAKVVVSVDADFMGTFVNPTGFMRQFSNGRRDFKNMNKLVVFDSNYSLTGANADIRVKIKPSLQLDVVMGLAHEIIVKKGQTKFAGNGTVKSALQPFANAAAKIGIEPALFSQIASDLLSNQGSSLVMAGGMTTMTKQSRSLQIAVNLLNSALNNDGQTVNHANHFVGLDGSYSDVLNLINDMKNGSVKTLIIHGTNPAYAFPKAAGFVEALKKVEMVIYTGDRMDETALSANYILPDNHPMESWGDAEIVKGV